MMCALSPHGASMPNIAAVLKSEIARVARKEIRAQTTSLKKAVAGYRHDIATLKKRIQDLERQLKKAGRSPRSAEGRGEGEVDGGKQLRFSATRFASKIGRASCRERV